jgi:hypothetical protein
MFILFDSRSRSQTGWRRAHEFPETEEGVLHAWMLVLAEEAPDEAGDYLNILACSNLEEAAEVFNDYWSVYGWHMNRYEDDMVYPNDVDVITKVKAKE